MGSLRLWVKAWRQLWHSRGKYTGSLVRQSCHFWGIQDCPPNASKGPAQLFMGSLRLWVKAWRQLWHSRGKYRQFWPQKLSLLRDPGLPSERFKGPRTAFHGQLATLGQSLETAVTLQGQVQAAGSAKAVPSKGSRTALPTLQKAPHSFSRQLATLGQSLDTAVTLQGQVQAAGSAKAVPSKGSRTALPTLQRARTAFHGQLATLGQSLDTAVTLQGQVQAVFAAKAVTSKGSRTALRTLQRAPHSFSWAACDFRSKLGDSCDTPGASTGSWVRQSCPF